MKKEYLLTIILVFLFTYVSSSSYFVSGVDCGSSNALSDYEYQSLDSQSPIFSLFVAPDGSDTNSGTEDHPFRTINRAAEVALAGDAVLVKNGMYREVVTVQNSGTEQNPIQFVAEDGVVIDGTEHSFLWGGIFQVDSDKTPYPNDTLSYITISGFHLINAEWYGFMIHRSSHITIENCFVKNTESSGIWVHDSDHILIKNNKVRNACAYTKKDKGSNECITVSDVNTFQVIYNEVYESSSGATGGEGIDTKDGCNHGEVAYNIIHDNIRLGIYVECWESVLTDVRVHSNFVYNNFQGIAIASEEGGTVRDVQVVNNLVFNNTYNGIIVPGWKKNGPRENISINCNTVVQNGNNKSNYWNHSAPDYAGGIAVEPETNASGITIRNNIVSENRRWQIRADLSSDQDITCDHNLINGFHGYSYETRGIDFQEGNPGFVNPVMNNYMLQATSIAIDTGSLPFLAPLEDILGNLRPQKEGIDIGAYEYTEPISINGNLEFAATVIAHNWPGDGSSLTPYVVEGLSLSGTAKNLIEIQNTDVHFQIRDCVISNGDFGIYLSNVTNGHIIGNKIINHEFDGIFLVDNSAHCTISNNTVYNNSAFGVHLLMSNNNNISYNHLYDHKWSGINLNNSKYNDIINNSAYNANIGIEVRSSNSNTFFHNIAYSNRLNGLTIDSGSEDNSVQWNDFAKNNIGAQWLIQPSQVADDGKNNIFINNYFEDWTGTGSYAIDGSAGNFDLFPRSNPNHLFAPVIIFPTSDTLTLEESVIIQWTESSDLFGHSITYSIFYSSTNGASWTTLASGRISTIYLWNLESIDAGTEVLLKVHATDSVGFSSSSIYTTVFTINPISTCTTLSSTSFTPTETSLTTTLTTTIITTTTTTTPGWNDFLLLLPLFAMIAVKLIKKKSKPL
ncbi:MAG: right-handed parallel beta-helix repeat-containing protein [Candidatus Heimdallarchaeota archaeon]|nr:MAG: right-handed parallel beta-helix repeat-containing protein [Candidatus Heimdallarchaeota archaeon]